LPELAELVDVEQPIMEANTSIMTMNHAKLLVFTPLFIPCSSSIYVYIVSL
jgi:hypothetical protein